MTAIPMSTLDEQYYEIRLVDSVTQEPITSGTVKIRLCTVDTATALSAEPACEASMTHRGDGWWTAVHTTEDLDTALSGVPIFGLFDCVAIISGRGARRIARHRRVAVVADG